MLSDVPRKDSIYTLDKQVQISSFRRFSQNNDLNNNNEQCVIPMENEKGKHVPKKSIFKRIFSCCSKEDSEAGEQVTVIIFCNF